MRFSVIIPVYNAEKYIEQTLCELLKQDRTLFEIVLVDDGSRDKSGEICDRYADDHPDQIKVIHQQNQGQLAARWNGIQMAVGEYCLFQDADDSLEAGCFEEMNEILTRQNDPDMLIYSFIYEYQDGTSKRANTLYRGEQVIQNKADLYRVFFTGTLLNNVWTKLVKRTVLMNCELDVNRYTVLRCAEDRLHSMEMLTRAGSVVYCDRPWYHYRLMDGSVTRQYTPDAIDRFNDSDLYEITKEYISQWQLDPGEYGLRLIAGYADHTVYVFDLFYKKARRADRKRLFAYDWSRFLPDEVLRCYPADPYINSVKKKYLDRILKRRRAAIAVYVGKRELKKKLKAKLKG